MPDRDPIEIMELATSGIQEADSFADWLRNANLGTIIMSITVAISGAILALGQTILGPFQAVGSGLSRVLEGTFFAATDIIEAGSAATVASLLDGVAQWLGPAAFPVSVLSVVAAIYILRVGFQQFAPLDWIRSNFRR